MNMKLGVHTSIAGGLYKALLQGDALGCQVVQFFTQAPSQWKIRVLSREEIRTFQETARRSAARPAMTHTSYLINLATPCAKLAKKSLGAFEAEMVRAEELGVPFVVAHPGAHMGEGEKKGLERIARRLDTLHRRTAGFRTRVLLETTSGQGTVLGHRFEQLEEIISRVSSPERLGVCLDTCHLFAAGYDLRTRESYRSTMECLDRTVGIHRVKAVHLNDSKRELGSRVDRHTHIGKGEIGLKGFRNLMADGRFRGVPMVLETPKGKGSGAEEDRKNLQTLRKMIPATGKGGTAP
jgi:deoxyribonuclease-4